MKQRCVLEIVEVILSELLSADKVFLEAWGGCQEPHQNVENKEKDDLGTQDKVPVVVLDALIVGKVDGALEPVLVEPGRPCR